MKKKETVSMSKVMGHYTLTYEQSLYPSRICTTADHSSALSVLSIENLVTLITRSKGVLFKIKNNSLYRRKYVGKTALGERVLRILKNSIEEIKNHFPTHKFNPKVDLFFDESMERHLHELAWRVDYLTEEECAQWCDVLNGFINSIRTKAQSAAFRKAYNNYQRSSKENNAELNAYLNAWFRERSRIVVLRVDFGYLKEHGWPSGKASSVTYEETKKHRKDFFGKMRSHPELFEHMLGYAIKLENGLHKGFHYHGLMLFDGSKVREDVTLARLIGEYWVNTITAGKGLYFNCNAQKDVYPVCGIGMVHCDDAEAREGLKMAALYMTKPDSLIKLVVPGKDRTFFKGEMPKPKAIKRGRPRFSSKQPLANPVQSIWDAAIVPPQPQSWDLATDPSQPQEHNGFNRCG